MIYLSLFWEFLKIGLFSFGGGYVAIPMILDTVTRMGWMSEQDFANIVAVSESTPGPIMVNAATYVGSTQAGILGAACATLGVVLPSFVIIILISVFLKKVINSSGVQASLKGIKPSIMGIILATGTFMTLGAVAGSIQSFKPDFMAIIILAALVLAIVLNKKIRKKSLSPILLIVISAVMGCVLYSF